MASAAERLRAINEAIETREWMGEQLWRALPEIIAVVAAAETVKEIALSPSGMSLEARLGAVDFHLSNALYHLASKLSGEGQ